MKHLKWGVVIAGLGLVGCVEDGLNYHSETAPPPVETPESTPIEEPEVEVTVPSGLHLATCDAQMDWWTAQHQAFVSTGFFGISPNKGLVVRAGQYAGRMAYDAGSGEPLFMLRQDIRAHSMDEDWRVFSALGRDEQGRQTLTIQSLITQNVLRDIDTGLDSVGFTMLTPNAESIIALGCDGEQSALVVHDSMTGEPRVHVALDAECGIWSFFPDPPIALSDDQQTLAVGLGYSGGVAIVDLGTGEWSEFDAHPIEEETQLFYGGAVIGVTMSPGGQQVATSGHDDMVRVWNLPEMTLEAEFESKAAMVNEMTYMPSLSSAVVSWSPDGLLLAHSDKEGHIALRQTDNWTLVTTLERPITEEDEMQSFRPDDHLLNAPIAVAWGADMATIALSTQNGLGLWHCDGTEAPTPGTGMTVTLEGPAQLRVGEPATFVATHFGSDDLHGHAFFINGEPIGQPSTEREIAWTPEQAGRIELRVVVDNGVEKTETAMVVDVE